MLPAGLETEGDVGAGPSVVVGDGEEMDGAEDGYDSRNGRQQVNRRDVHVRFHDHLSGDLAA